MKSFSIEVGKPTLQDSEPSVKTGLGEKRECDVDVGWVVIYDTCV